MSLCWCDYAECCYDECHFAQCHYAKCHYAEYHYAECGYDEYHFAESHYAICHCAERNCAECHILNVMISVIRVSSVMLRDSLTLYLCTTKLALKSPTLLIINLEKIELKREKTIRKNRKFKGKICFLFQNFDKKFFK
jgi:hypothetical protein